MIFGLIGFLLSYKRSHSRRVLAKHPKNQLLICIICVSPDWIDIFPSNETSYETGLNKILHALLPEKEKGLRALLKHMGEDLIARESELLENSSIPSKQWFVQEVSRCNVGEHYYINRLVKVDGKTERLEEQVKHWLEHETQPYLFVVGISGIGKTNSLIAEVIAPIVEKNIKLIKNSQPPNQAIVFFRLGSYNPEPGVNFWSNFEELVNSRIQPETARISEETFRQLVKNGTIILILDGLDEFMRIHGEDVYGFLFGVLQSTVDSNKAKIIISCREHIYQRLKGRSLFKKRRSKVIKIDQLGDNEVKEALKKRLGEESRGYRLLTDPNHKLYKFVRRPLLLEMMCEISDEAWEQLRDECHAADLYNLWFDEIISKNRKEEEHLRKVASAEIRERIGEIAIRMLEDRSDFLHESVYQKEKLLPAVIEPKKQKLLGIFIKQTETDWSFVHDSFREFSLVKKLVSELLSGEYDFLKRTASFDYLGAETYEFVSQLFHVRGDDGEPIKGGYVEPIKKALESNTSASRYSHKEWNNIVRNCFEAIGMIADDELEQIEKSIEKPGFFIHLAIKFLRSPTDSTSTALNYKTKYNIVRCLGRLHRSSSKRPYFKLELEEKWSDPPSPLCFGAMVVKGFRLKTPEVRLFPPVAFRTAENNCSNA